MSIVDKRRQLTAFLPPPLRAQVDSVRRRWDPEMATLIGGHFTVCHRVLDGRWESSVEALAKCESLRVRIGGARHWGDPSRGIYLEVSDLHSTVSRLRELISVADSPDTVYEPHVTLTHPRTTPPEVARDAWAELDGWTLDAEIQIDVIDLIQHDGVAWRTLDRVTPGVNLATVRSLGEPIASPISVDIPLIGEAFGLLLVEQDLM